MSYFTDFYVATQLGKRAGDYLSNKVDNTINVTKDMYYDAKKVSSLRNTIYDMKAKVASMPLTSELINLIIDGDVKNPPNEICVCANIIAISHDSLSGKAVYESENIDYTYACGLLLIIQDMYPGAYEMNKVILRELTEQLNNGTWWVVITKKKNYVNNTIEPAFTSTDLINKPINTLPLTLKDPLQKNKKLYSILSYLALVLAIILFQQRVYFVFMFFPSLIVALAGFVLGCIGAKKCAKSATIALMLNLVLCVLSIAFGLIPVLFLNGVSALLA